MCFGGLQGYFQCIPKNPTCTKIFLKTSQAEVWFLSYCENTEIKSMDALLYRPFKNGGE